MADKPEEKKIVVDEDWKTRAQAEKEELARQAAGQPAEASAAEPEARGPLPAPSFHILVSQWATQALIALGEVPDPVTQKRQTDLAHAKFAIDMLGILEDKTRGNLTPEEKRLLDTMLFELRMKFVDASRS